MMQDGDSARPRWKLAHNLSMNAPINAIHFAYSVEVICLSMPGELPSMQRIKRY